MAISPQNILVVLQVPTAAEAIPQALYSFSVPGELGHISRKCRKALQWRYWTADSGRIRRGLLPVANAHSSRAPPFLRRTGRGGSAAEFATQTAVIQCFIMVSITLIIDQFFTVLYLCWGLLLARRVSRLLPRLNPGIHSTILYTTSGLKYSAGYRFKWVISTTHYCGPVGWATVINGENL